MKPKRAFLLFLLAAVLAALVYLQVRQWHKFDWDTFWQETKNIRWSLILLSVALVYIADSLRAWRWATFLKPATQVTGARLVAPQFVGFAGLALLGRPGELIRPYLIGKRVGMSLSSQIAVWTVERIFDIATVTTFLLLDVFLSESLQELGDYETIRSGAIVLGVLVLAGIAVALLLRRYGRPFSSWVEGKLARRFPNIAHRVCQRVNEFSEGLNTIQDLRSFLTCAIISILIWSAVAVSYRLVTFAYHDPEVSRLDIPQVVLLMCGSIAGGVLQLPVIGGGSQLATISIMKSDAIFNVRPELATSCGMLLWLVTFMSVAPAGLILARREHISLRAVAREEEAELKAAGD